MSELAWGCRDKIKAYNCAESRKNDDEAVSQLLDILILTEIVQLNI